MHHFRLVLPEESFSQVRPFNVVQSVHKDKAEVLLINWFTSFVHLRWWRHRGLNRFVTRNLLFQHWVTTAHQKPHTTICSSYPVVGNFTSY